jgi:hypothetical protein
MTLRSLFIREHDGSRCGRGLCAHDSRCSDSHCAGHPSRNEVGYEAAMVQSDGAIDTEPESWAVILAILGWLCFVIGAALAAFAVAAFSDWTPAIWPRAVVALNFWS